MSTELPKTYDPSSAQSRWIEHWETRGYCNADPHPEREQHTIMIPLPNVTGALHMGHCLNGTIQDLLTRWRRMQGHEALWMPGTDHAGIATQAVVERRMLEEEGKTRHDIGREALVERIWKWKDQYEARILNQLKQIGASCDWRRVRFTLDDVCSKAVRRTFFKMFCDAKIFRGKRLVNWDAHLQTAVADDEVYTEDINGHFWTFRYPVVDDDGQPTDHSIQFSTTRPETMLGDTAVCVHPTDERYTDLIGRKVLIPCVGRVIPIIADGLLADKELGTGAVKVTPAHDPNDYACWNRNSDSMQDPINILNADGTINEHGGEFEGQDRYDARKGIVAKMDELGFFDGVEDREIPMKYSDRSKTPIEPYLSDQWFVRMDELAQSAMDAVRDNRVRIFPQRYTKTYMDWLGEKRDWCISRQLWWGHRIPVWTKVYESDDPRDGFIASMFDIASTVDDLPENPLDQIDDLAPTASVDFMESSIDFDTGKSSLILRGRLKGALHAQYEVDGPVVTCRICVPESCDDLEAGLEAAGFVQDEDVLDTWFSSALWPHATLGWPDTENNPPLAESALAHDGDGQGEGAGADGNAVLNYFYPGSVLVTSRDIITLWVARMVLTGLYNMGDVPFRHVYIHPKIQDGFGQTMSKSKGNGVDPVDLIDKYGTDAVRFTIASLCGETQDVRLPVGYECPDCGETIDSKQYTMGAQTVVVPRTMKGALPVPQGEPKPTVACPKCRKESQFSTPLYDPDPGEAVARIVSERFEYGRNFCNKLWNACRFAFMNLEGFEPGPIPAADLQMEDQWILSRLSTTAKAVTTQLDRYQFDQATRTIREFTWNEFCDWYLEMIKPRLKDETARPLAQRHLVFVTDNLLRLLHPFAPFITEELWHKLNELTPQRSADVSVPSVPQGSASAASHDDADPGFAAAGTPSESIMTAAWPELGDDFISDTLESRFERLQQIIVAVRNIRGFYKISPKEPLKLFMRCSPEIAEQMQAVADQFDNLSRTMLAAAGLEVNRPGACGSFTIGDADGYIPLEGLIDTEAEKARLEKEAAKITGHIQGAEKKLSNEKFVNGAPEQVVNDVRATLEKNRTQLASIQQNIADLSDPSA